MEVDEIVGKLKRQQSRRHYRRRFEFEQLQELIYLFETHPTSFKKSRALRREYRRRIAEAALAHHHLKVAATIGAKHWPNKPRFEQASEGMEVLASRGCESQSLPKSWLRWYPSRSRALVDRITACGLASRYIGYVADMLQTAINDIDSHKERLGCSEDTSDPIKAIQREALKAVTDAKFTTMLCAADGVPSSEKVSAVMSDLRNAKRDDEDDPNWWTLDRWIIELGLVGIRCTRSTIIGNKKKGVPPCKAWAEIRDWQESNKQSRYARKLGVVSKKTGRKI